MSQLLSWLVCLVLGAFGLVFGSFANVLIWRMPRGESIVSPGSRCPSCEHPIRWYDNVPVISWLALRGKCRDCGEPIAWRYPAVELASGALWVLAFWRWGLSPSLPLAIVFFYVLLVLAVIDIDTRRLPTPLVAVIAVAGWIGVLAHWVTGLEFGPLIGSGGGGWLGHPAVVAMIGFVAGGGTSVAVATLYSLLRKADGLGFGDVRLLGAMGIVLGPYVLLAYALANVFGVFGAIPVMIRGRRAAREEVAEDRVAGDRDSGDAFWDRDAVPPSVEDSRDETPAVGDEADSGSAPTPPLSIQFGPFLALAGVVTALWGPALWHAYLHTVGMV